MDEQTDGRTSRKQYPPHFFKVGGIIIEIREKACVHVHQLEIIAHKSGNGNNCQPFNREYMKGEEGSGGGSPPPPPRSQRNEKKSNKMEASPFR